MEKRSGDSKGGPAPDWYRSLIGIDMEVIVDFKVYTALGQKVTEKEFYNQPESGKAYYSKYYAGSLELIYKEQKIILEPEDLDYVLNGFFLRNIPKICINEQVMGSLMEKERYAICFEPTHNNHEIKIFEYIFSRGVSNIVEVTQEMIVPKEAFLISLYKCIERFNSFYTPIKGWTESVWKKDLEIAKEALQKIGIEV